jgi:hypothetical protein
MLSARDALPEALASRERLAYALQKAVDLLRPAGVKGACTLRALREIQPSTDRLRIVAPLRLREAGSVGADRLRDGGGVFEESDFDGSTFH